MKIAILALQGAFVEHERMLRSLGVETFEVRNKDDWQQPKDGLIIPGGESTTMVKLLHDLDLLTSIQREIGEGLPVFGLSLIHISEPTRLHKVSRMPSSA